MPSNAADTAFTAVFVGRMLVMQGGVAFVGGLAPARSLMPAHHLGWQRGPLRVRVREACRMPGLAPPRLVGRATPRGGAATGSLTFVLGVGTKGRE